LGLFDRLRRKDYSYDTSKENVYEDVYMEVARHSRPDFSGFFRRSNYVLDTTAFEVKKALESDATLRQIVSRYTEITLSQGFKIRSNDKKFDEYLQMRIREIETASGKKIGSVIERAMRNLIAYGNFFINIERNKENSSGRVYNFPKGNGMDLEPVSSLFVIDPYGMSIRRGKYGTVVSYQHNPNMYKDVFVNIDYNEDIIPVPVGKTKETHTFSPENMIHGMYEPSDYAFGRSFLIEALEDLLILRMIESTMSYMIENKEFVVIVHKIGTKEAPGTQQHVNNIKRIIEQSDVNGEIIVPGNHEIEIKEMSTLKDVMSYAEYFKKRYFSAVGMSTVGMGEPGAANRATAETTNEAMYDKARSFQRALAEAFETQFLDHIVYDFGIRPENMSERDRPKIVFPDPDLDRVTKLENQAIFDYENNAITEDEMRERLKLEPIEERSGTYFDLITLRQLEQSAKLQQQYSPKTTMEASNRANPQNQHNR